MAGLTPCRRGGGYHAGADIGAHLIDGAGAVSQEGAGDVGPGINAALRIKVLSIRRGGLPGGYFLVQVVDFPKAALNFEDVISVIFSPFGI
jgi:hypothetical protein